MNVQKEDNGVNRDYPMTTLRAFGGLHIGIGILCAILGIAVFIIDNVNMSKDCYIDNNGSYIDNNGTAHDEKECENQVSSAQTFFVYDIICFLFSGWFIITGSFPFCMTQRRQSSWRCLKITFMVCNIVAATLFVPGVFSFRVFGAVVRVEPRTDTVVLSSFIAVLGAFDWILAIAAASYCCCCTSWDDTDKSVVYVTFGQHANVEEMPNSKTMQSKLSQDGSKMRSGIYPAVDMTQ
ncbi:uncharacterized protein LOC134684126 [Mytilus trossulus]|uniref:uncharacterized protein LOC134684126 n=1 Tax=Mytilus trossulus TaxID=6551 RepID=UPI0030045CFA